MENKEYSLLECAIEFAWQIGDKNHNIARAESRHDLVNTILEFSKKENLPEDDIEDFIGKYIEKNNLK